MRDEIIARSFGKIAMTEKAAPRRAPALSPQGRGRYVDMYKAKK
jgi:hypothetical protein